jgi:hypothetical protein
MPAMARRHRCDFGADRRKAFSGWIESQRPHGFWARGVAAVIDWLDNGTIAQRTRNRILGQVTDVPGGYGRKGTINANQMAAISALEPDLVKQMREILMAAKTRAEREELIVLTPLQKKWGAMLKHVATDLPRSSFPAFA